MLLFSPFQSVKAQSSRTVKDGLSEIRLYPNPVEDYLLLKTQDVSDILRIEVFNILGSKMLIENTKQNSQVSRFNLTHFPKGVYMVRIYNPSNEVIFTKSISKI